MQNEECIDMFMWGIKVPVSREFVVSTNLNGMLQESNHNNVTINMSTILKEINCFRKRNVLIKCLSILDAYYGGQTWKKEKTLSSTSLLTLIESIKNGNCDGAHLIKNISIIKIMLQLIKVLNISTNILNNNEDWMCSIDCVLEQIKFSYIKDDDIDVVNNTYKTLLELQLNYNNENN